MENQRPNQLCWKIADSIVRPAHSVMPRSRRRAVEAHTFKFFAQVKQSKPSKYHEENNEDVIM
jgi:uncharacterized protein (UPF0305 family)